MIQFVELTGTDGDDIFEVSGPDNVTINSLGGSDKVNINLSGSYGRIVTIDLDSGDDIVTVDASFNEVYVNGGPGRDTFILKSGGMIQDFGGPNTYKASATPRAPGDPVVSIKTFSTSDIIDISDFLKTSSGWTPGTSTIGYARLAYVGTSTFVQAKYGSGWVNLMELDSVNPSGLKEAQIGFTPDIVVLPKFTISAPAQHEGGAGSFTILLEAPADHDITISGVITTLSGPPTLANYVFGGGTRWSVVIPAGAKSAVVETYIGEDARPGSGALILVDPAEAMLSGSLATVTSLSLIDNDNANHSVSWRGAKATYESFTLQKVTAGSSIETALNALAAPDRAHSERDVFHQIAAYAQGTTSVALASYQFFTGKTPGAAGLEYLVSPTGPNTNNLNSAYYQTFNFENRYINFAVNLGKVGEGVTKFTADYGQLSLFEATRKAYVSIFGGTANDAKVQALLDGRVAYFAAYGGDGAEGLGTKAAMVGWLLAESMKADTGVYARAVDNFYLDLSDGTAQHNIDLVAVYGPGTFLDAFGN